MPCQREAFVSLATNDFYATGALTLGKSIRDVGTSRKLALMVTSGVSADMRQRLLKVWDELVEVQELNSDDTKNLALLARPELGVTFTKINAWTLTQYSKCVFLDADTLVMQSVDELFDREELSASPDIGWPDCFNSGVFVFQPSDETFKSLMELSKQAGSFDGGDQGLLNLYWPDWAYKDIKYHLPFVYNITPNVTYGYAPAFVRFGANVKIIHFIGPIKPWQHNYVKEMDSVVVFPGTYASQSSILDFIKRWWQVYTSLEQDPSLPREPDTGGVNLLGPGSLCHRHEFESGLIDYSGRDSFDNIREHLDSWMGQTAGVELSQEDVTLRSKRSSTLSKTITGASTQPQKKKVVRTKSATSTSSTSQRKSGPSKSSAVQQKTPKPSTPTTAQRKIPKTSTPSSTPTTAKKSTSSISSPGSGAQKQVTLPNSTPTTAKSSSTPTTAKKTTSNISSPGSGVQKQVTLPSCTPTTAKTTSSISSPGSEAQKQVTSKAPEKPSVRTVASSPKTSVSSPATTKKKITSSISNPTSGAQKQVTSKATARVAAKPSVGATPASSSSRPTSLQQKSRSSSFSSTTTQKQVISKDAVKATAKPGDGVTGAASPKTPTPSSRPTTTQKTTRSVPSPGSRAQKPAAASTQPPTKKSTSSAAPTTKKSATKKNKV